MSKDDYSNLSEDHPRKQAIRRVAKTVNLPVDTLKAQTKSHMNIYKSLKIAMFISSTFNTSALKNFFVTSNFLYSYFTPKYQKMLLTKCFNKPKAETVISLWNIIETPLLKKTFVYTFERILMSQLIFIPRTAPLITETSQFHPQPSPFRSSHAEFHIPVLVLSPVIIPLVSQKLTTLIIHVHGGAHIAQSTFSHQSYTRRWSNSLNLPIFSIEYRLAPTHPFPAGVDDVWQVYVWLVSQSESQLGITPSKIILAGDSAGGNLIVAITLKAIQCGFRVPDGLLAVYPVLNHNYKRVSLGTLLQLEDIVLNYSFFKPVIKAYVIDEDLLDNYLVSPLWCDEKLLDGFPKTRFMVTLNDPLFIDSLMFADRLLEKARDVVIYEYPNLIHGALTFASPLGMAICEKFYQDSLVLLRELVS